MSAEFKVEGWDEFTKRCEGVVDRWEAKKLELMNKMATVCLEEISPLIPVDTSNLVSKFQIGEVSPDTAEVGTNVEYALYVNDGHIQRKRFLPITYLSSAGRRKYLKPGNDKGIMLKEKYIPGVYFLENGMQNAKPRMESLIESFMEQIMREMEGGSL